MDTTTKSFYEDFEVNFAIDSYESISSSINSVSERDAKIQSYLKECNEEISRLTSHADGVDLLSAVCCGILSGVVDSLLVGKWDFAGAKALSNKDVNQSVIDFAKKNPKYEKFLGRGRDGDRIENALKFLEKEFHLPGDSAYQNKGLNMKISGRDHRLADFCHHNSLVGLISCVLVQFTEESILYNKENESFSLPIVVNSSGEFQGRTPLAKVFGGVINWFFNCAKAIANRKGHLFSDKATPQGIPGTFMSIMKELSTLPCFKDSNFSSNLHKAYANGIGDNPSQLDLGIFNELFKGSKDASSKFDLRTEMAIGHELKRQSVPVLINEMLVRSVYFIRRFIAEMKNTSELANLDWGKCVPFKNRTIGRMVTVASGTFVAIDLSDALIRSAIESKADSAAFASGVILRINFVGIGRFAIACAVDTTSGMRKTSYEFASLSLETGKTAVTAEKIFVNTKERIAKALNREKKLSDMLEEEISVDESQFSLEDAQLAVKEIAENKIHNYEEMKARPWYKKLYAAITFHSNEKKLALENIKDTAQILSLFMNAHDSDMKRVDSQLDKLVALMEVQQSEKSNQNNDMNKDDKTNKNTIFTFFWAKPERVLAPDADAKYKGKYKLVSVKEPEKAISIYRDKTILGGLNALNGALKLVSKNQLDITVWEIESCGKNIYRIFDSKSNAVITYDYTISNKKQVFAKKWKDTPACVWEIKELRKGQVMILSNQQIELGLSQFRGNKVGVSKAGRIHTKWILEPVE